MCFSALVDWTQGGLAAEAAYALELQRSGVYLPAQSRLVGALDQYMN